MATLNPFDLLGDDTEDPSLLAAQQPKIEPKKATVTSAKQPPQPKLPSKPLPPAQAETLEAMETHMAIGKSLPLRVHLTRVMESLMKDGVAMEHLVVHSVVAVEAVTAMEKLEKKWSALVGHLNAGVELDVGINEMKREGSGRGNWGAPEDELAPLTEEVVNGEEKNLNVEKPLVEVNAAVDGEKEAAKDENEEKEAEDKEMTLEEYEKLLEEKRKAMMALKTEERKVDGKEFASMQQLADKKANDDIFIKLGSEKDKKKDLAEKEERAKKSVSINEFLKPAEGERYYSPGGRGRGRGRGPRGGGYVGSSDRSGFQAPAIEDPGQFPTLGGK
ncbi:hypothetical protein SASPL_147589 [Salvia splendens]|uniref:Hyaluronan/mRNA-binding protein domain-containing protein n=1 Tax=Salvia splendens TaxID=180675 RepID=A0A8X8WEV9_SALSN|nr:hypothetical protein SASPL_147589 [Salvia splendens]